MVIKVNGPIVAKLGNSERTGQMWPMLMDQVVLPHFDLELFEYDLGVPNQVATDSSRSHGVVVDASRRLREVGVGMKDATITLGQDRVREFQLTRAYDSPNGIGREVVCTDPTDPRRIRGGALVREAIYANNIPTNVRSWKGRIVVMRKAVGGIYGSKGLVIPGAGKLQLTFLPEDGAQPVVIDVRDFAGKGAAFVESDTELELRDYLRCCFVHALELGLPLMGGAKHTIERYVHGLYRQIFLELQEEFREQFEAKKLWAQYLIVDDLMSQVFSPNQRGGFVLALMPYDGDVQSDSILTAMGGSLGMMRSYMITPDGVVEYEVGHGTVTRHYRLAQQGEDPPTNPMAQVSTISGAISCRGKRSRQPEVVAAGRLLLKSGVRLIERGVMPGDIIQQAGKQKSDAVGTMEFIRLLGENFSRAIAASEHERMAETITL